MQLYNSFDKSTMVLTESALLSLWLNPSLSQKRRWEALDALCERPLHMLHVIFLKLMAIIELPSRRHALCYELVTGAGAFIFSTMDVGRRDLQRG